MMVEVHPSISATTINRNSLWEIKNVYRFFPVPPFRGKSLFLYSLNLADLMTCR